MLSNLPYDDDQKNNDIVKKNTYKVNFVYNLPFDNAQKNQFLGEHFAQFSFDWYNNLSKILRSNFFVTVSAENAPLPKCHFFNLHSLEEIQKKCFFSLNNILIGRLNIFFKGFFLQFF